MPVSPPPPVPQPPPEPQPAASPAAKPTSAPAPAPPPPTTAPAAAATQAGCPNQPAASGARKLKVGLVTDVGKVEDKNFNQSAWEGVQCAQKNLGTDAKFIETTDPKDYGKNIDEFAQDNYDVIVTVGFALGDDTITEARKYSKIKFIGVDQFQADTVPNRGLSKAELKARRRAGRGLDQSATVVSPAREDGAHGALDPDEGDQPDQAVLGDKEV
jgi:basic membrane protein A